VAEEAREYRSRAEWVRLLYVAMTRAKSRLVVSGKWRDSSELVATGDIGCFADLTAHRSAPDEMEEQARSGRVRRSEPGGLVTWVLPDAEPAGREHETVAARPVVWMSEERAEAEALRLAELRPEAETRQSKSLAATATGLAHRPLEGESAMEDEQPAAERDVAMIVGTEIHRLLEVLDLEGDLEAQVKEIGPPMAERVAGLVPAPERGEAIRRLEELVATVRSGGCLRRLGELSGDVAARELPLLMPPRPEDPVLGAVVGTADLVYRENGGLVVADFKTDAVVSAEEIEERAEAYRPQLELYGRAIKEALSLETSPALELWFLNADQITRL
jgi:ATP-dependent exoDNAse (exonuclease V) beta subunit